MVKKANNAPRSYRLEELARLVDGRLVNQPDAAESGPITGLGTLAGAAATDLTHLSRAAYQAELPNTQAGAVLLREEDVAACPTAAIVVTNPYWAYARLSQLFEREPAVAGDTRVDPDAIIAADVSIGAGACVGAGAVLKSGVVIHANAVVGAAVELQKNVTIHAGAVIADGVFIGAGSTIHANAVIGGEGFGYAPNERGVLERIAQLGSVVLGKDVSVGAGSTIDRGALDDTRIGDGVKIDNQVQIGHNCVIGNHSVICGCCGIVGSTTIGAHCVLGGAVGVGGDGPITLCDGVTVSGMTHVSRSIDTPGIYSGGVLHSESRRWKRNALRFANLDGIAKRLAALEKRLSGTNDKN